MTNWIDKLSGLAAALKSKGFDDLMLICFLPPWKFVIAAGKNAHYFVATMITIGRPSIVALLLTSPPGSANTVSNRKMKDVPLLL